MNNDSIQSLFVYSKPITLNKTLEIESYLVKPFYDWFRVSFIVNRKMDHAGGYFQFAVLGLTLSISLHDVRHWDHENDSWFDQEDDQPYTHL